MSEYWYHDHLKRKKHKEHARNLDATFRNNDTVYSLSSNDCNESLNSNVDNNEVERNNDSSTTPVIIGNNQDRLSSIDVLSFNDDNEVSNVDDDNYDNNDINNTTTIINECNNNESVTIHDDNEVSNNNNINTINVLHSKNNDIDNNTTTFNNCYNLKLVVDSCSSIEEYINYLKDTSDVVDKDMIYQLTLLEPTYHKHRDYFFACIENKGPNFFVHKSLGQSNHQYVQRNNSNTMHALLQTKLCMGLSIQERTDYASILKQLLANPEQLITNLHHQKSVNCNNIPTISINLDSNNSNTRLPLYTPSNASDIRTDLMEGKNSILNNLPTPEPQPDKPSGYIYIPVKETIIFMFASENPPVPFLPFDGCVHAKTEKGKELLPELQSNYTDSIPNNCFFLEVILWADGFLAHQFSVLSEASAHVCFITIGAPNGDQSGSNTFLVWLGPQRNSPENVEFLLVEEINRLTSSYFPVYHHKMKRIVNVKLKLFVFLGDKIEKYKRLGLLQGQAYGARFGYVGDLMDDFDKVPCCDACQLHLLQNDTEGTNTCSDCWAFNFSGKTYRPNKHYPTNSLFGSDDMILPYKQISLKKLPAIMTTAFENYVNREKGWTTKASVNSFLRSEGLCNTLQREIIDNAARRLLYNDTVREANNDPDSALLREMKFNFSNCPEDYRVPQSPHFWNLMQSQFDVIDCIDAPAHLLFLGIAKSLYKDIFSMFLSGTKKNKSFVTILNQKLSFLSHAKVSYIKVKEKAGDKELKFTEYLSKHYTLLCRCSKWLFNHFGKSAADKSATAVVPTHKRFFEYKKKEILQFCHERLIDCPMSDKETEKNYRRWFCELIENPIESFADYNDEDICWFIFNENQNSLFELLDLDTDHRRMMFFNYVQKYKRIPPKRLFEFSCDISDKVMTNLTQLLLCIVSRAMVGLGDIDRHVKLFLTQTNRIERLMEKASKSSKKRKQTLPLIIGRMNFISLINMQDTVERYGPMRLLWELGVYGEGSIPSIKQLISSTQTGYAVPVSKKYLNNHGIKNAFLQLRGTHATKKELTDRDGTIVCDAMCGTNKRDCPIGHGCFIIPIVVSLRDNKIYMYDKEYNSYRRCKIMTNNKPVTECGVTYFYFQSSNTDTTLPSNGLLSNDIIVGLMMKHSDAKYLYYVIRWDWTELIVDENNTIVFNSPRFENCSY